MLEALKRATIGEYDIYSPLGRGGMASVFLALELSLNRPVAIKVISPSALSSATVIDRFWLEARTAASLSHPHVIPIFAVKAVGGLHFFVMKHIQGGSLDVILKNEGPFSYALTRTILTQVAGALAYAHRRGVIHRDVKPGNIMLDDEGFAVVMDFGIAKVRDVAALTASGAMVGTPYYMSPEQFGSDKVDGRSDQYSLGVVAYELLTGKRPFKGTAVAEVLRGHLFDKAPDVRELRPDCSTSLATVLNRMLCKAPSDRFPSMEALCTQLEAMPRLNGDKIREQIISLARTASSSSPQISQPVSPVPYSRTSMAVPASPTPADKASSGFTTAAATLRRRPWLSASVAAAVVATGVMMMAANKESAPPPPRQLATSLRDESLDKAPPASAAIKAPSANIGADSSALTMTVPNVVLDSGVRPPARTMLSKALPATIPKPARDRLPTTSVARKVESNERFAPGDGTPQEASTSSSVRLSSVPTGITQFRSDETQAVTPPEPPPPTPVFRIGSRNPAAFLYVDGSFVGVISALRPFKHPAGRVRLQIRADDCITWDTAFSVSPGDTALIGYRNPKCGR